MRFVPITVGKFLWVMTALSAGPALAHHPAGGAMPVTFLDGLLSGLGHPIIEPDHLFFLLGTAIAAALARVVPGRAGVLLAAYAVAGAIGTLLRVPGLVLPLAEAAVAVSLALAALWLWTLRQPRGVDALLLAAGAGAVHGFAYGEAVIGAEVAPVVAYLAGLAMVQLGLMFSVYFGVLHLPPMAAKKLAVVSRVFAAMLRAGGLWLLWSRTLFA